MCVCVCVCACDCICQFRQTLCQLLVRRHEASAWAEIGAIERHLRKHAGAVSRKLINGGGRRANTEVDQDEEDDDEENVMAATGQFSNSDDDSVDDEDDNEEDEEGDDVMDMRSGTRGLGGRKISRGERLRHVVWRVRMFALCSQAKNTKSVIAIRCSNHLPENVLIFDSGLEHYRIIYRFHSKKRVHIVLNHPIFFHALIVLTAI